ncbi:hypothetical protein ACIPLC_07930 [Kitasatospora sp. NPDC086801]|uniref:hypothetical protein n=1 Tax=Kitasatospora sp. NPDC086801 TaxID=3364066 RepID=UPI00381A2D37
MSTTRDRRRGAALTTALALAVPVGTFGLVLVGTYLGGFAALLLGLVLTVAWVVGMVRLLGRWIGCWLALFAVALGGVATAAAHTARDDVILRLSGETATVRVAAETDRPAGKHPFSMYDLAAEDGSPLPGGELSTGLRALAVGDRVTVRFDPAGRANPQRPGDIGFLRDLGIAVGLTAALMLAVGWLGRESARRPQPRPRPRPRV